MNFIDRKKKLSALEKFGQGKENQYFLDRRRIFRYIHITYDYFSFGLCGGCYGCFDDGFNLFYYFFDAVEANGEFYGCFVKTSK